MIFSLLLQATPPQGPPYAIYATLAVGILSLIASGLNIYFSSKTAQKVVNLSTKTTREVAELSAQVSRESAGLVAQTAREIKEVDYKNDYYKKVIEKRVKAIESLEKMLSLFLTSTRISGSDNKFHSCFEESDIENKFSIAIDEIVSYNIWYSNETASKLRKFSTSVLLIIDSASRVNEKDKRGFFVREHFDLNNKVVELQKSMALDMYKLYEVDAFFKSRLELTDNT
jgi:hypothetical protein